jgi:hypothetical protein
MGWRFSQFGPGNHSCKTRVSLALLRKAPQLADYRQEDPKCQDPFVRACSLLGSRHLVPFDMLGIGE